MANEQEIQQLRRDLSRLQEEARLLSVRLNVLERQAAVPAAPPVISRPELVPTIPPAAAPAVSVPVPAPSQNETPQPSPTLPPPLPQAQGAARETTSGPSAPGWSLGPLLRRAWHALGPKEEMTWEMALGTYWLPRLAALLISIGVVWGLTLAVQKWGQEWLPYIQLGAAYAVAGILLGLGRFLERRRVGETGGLYLDYARVLMAAGMALIYFATYATHFVPYTRVIDQPAITLALLALLVLAWTLLAQWRRSWNLGFLVTVLGHFTVGLSTLELPEPSRFAVAGLLALSVASAFFLVRNGWYLLGLLGLAGSYVNHYLWLVNSPPSTAPLDFIVGMSVLVAYWLIFACAEFLAAAGPARAVSYRVRSAYVSLNSGGMLLLGLGLIDNFEFARGKAYLFLFTFAAVLLVMTLAYRRARPGDLLEGAYLTKAAAVAALGLAHYYEGAVLTASLALEAIVLLYASRRNQSVTSRILAILAAILGMLYGLYDVDGMPFTPWESADHFGMAAATTFILVSFLALSYVYQRGHWIRLAPETLARRPQWRHLLVKLGVIEPRDGETCNPFLWPNIFAIASVVLAALYLQRLYHAPYLQAIAAMAALLVATAGVLLGSRPFTAASLILSALSVYWWHVYALYTGMLNAGDEKYFEHVWLTLLTIAPLIVLAELARMTEGRGRWLEHFAGRHWPALLQHAYALAAAELSCFAVTMLIEPGERAAPLALAALVAGGYAFFLRASTLGLFSFAVFLYSGFILLVELMVGVSMRNAALALALLGAVSLLSEVRWLGQRPGLRFHQHAASAYVLYGVTAILAMLFAQEFSEPLNGMHLLVGIAVAAVAISRVLHERAWTALATLLFAWAAMNWMSLENNHALQQWKLGGVALVAATLLGGRYFTLRRAFARPVPESVLVTVAWGVLLLWSARLGTQEWQYAAWHLVAIALVAHAGAFRIAVAGGLSLLTAALTTLMLLGAAYETLSPVPLTAGFVAAIAYWFLLERVHAFALRRGLYPKRLDMAQATPVLVVIPPALLVILLERIPLLASFYLSIAWTVAAVLVMLVALVTHQRFYRYAALAIFTLALGRVMLIDTRQLEPIYRIAAVTFLGAVLLAVGFGYIKARDRARPEKERRAQPEAPPEEPGSEV